MNIIQNDFLKVNLKNYLRNLEIFENLGGKSLKWRNIRLIFKNDLNEKQLRNPKTFEPQKKSCETSQTWRKESWWKVSTIRNFSWKNLSTRKKSIQLSVNPIIKRNIVILNEMWNQQSLMMLIDVPCDLVRLKNTFALSTIFRSCPPLLNKTFLEFFVFANDDENKIFEATPPIRDKRECLKMDTRRSATKNDRLQSLTLVFGSRNLRLCVSECRFWMAQICVVSFLSSCVVNYFITHLSREDLFHPTRRACNERRVSVLFGLHDGILNKKSFPLSRSLVFVKY